MTAPALDLLPYEAGFEPVPEPPQHFYVYYYPDPIMGATEIKRLKVKQSWLNSFELVRREFDNLDIVCLYHGKEID